MGKFAIIVSKLEHSIGYLLLFFSVGAVLATPLLSGPAVLLAVIASILMVRHGLGTLSKLSKERTFLIPLLAIGFGFWFFSFLILTGIHRDQLKEMENPLRFLLALGVFSIIRHTNQKSIKAVLYSIVAGSSFAFLTTMYQRTYLGINDRLSGWTNNPIYFGNLSVLLSIYALIALVVLRTRISPQLRSLLVAAIFFAIAVSLSTQSRSSFLAMTSLLVLIGHVGLHRKYFITLLIIILVGVGIVFGMQPKLLERTRIIESMSEIHGIQHGNFDSSFGTRLQMWKGSALLFIQNPIIGVGSERYELEMKKLAARGDISVTAVIESSTGEAYNQPHSAFMEALACRGLIGITALMLIFALPFRLMHNLSKSHNQEVLALGLMGMATVIAFIVFGATNSIFRIQVYSSVYPISIAMFAALALNLKNNEEHNVATVTRG